MRPLHDSVGRERDTSWRLRTALALGGVLVVGGCSASGAQVEERSGAGRAGEAERGRTPVEERAEAAFDEHDESVARGDGETEDRGDAPSRAGSEPSSARDDADRDGSDDADRDGSDDADRDGSDDAPARSRPTEPQEDGSSEGAGGSASASGEAPRKVAVEAEATSGPEQPLSACERQARKRAREQALRALGTQVSSAFMDLRSHAAGRDHQAVADYAMHLKRGLVHLDYDPDEDLAIEAKPHGATCTLRAEATVRRPGRPDPSFRFRRLELDQPAYHVGQEATLHLELSRDARVYVLNADGSGRVTLVVPNEATGEGWRVGGGEPVRYPDERAEEAGLRLVAALPEAQERSVEVLHVVAVRGDADLFLPDDGRAERVGPYRTWKLGSMRRVMKRLAALERDRWTMGLVPFEIRRKRKP